MKTFWEFLLMEELPGDALSGLKFSLFGFGDSSYAKYNAMARKLYQRLLQLGAVSAIERGLGDDNKEGGYSVDLLVWKKKIFEQLLPYFPEARSDLLDHSGLNQAPAPAVSLKINEQKLGSKSENLEELLYLLDKKRIASPFLKGSSLGN